MSLDAMKQAYVALHNAYEGRLKTGEMLRAMTALRHAIYEVDAISPTPIEDWPRQWQGLTEEDREEILRWVEWKEIGSDQSVAPQKLIAYVEKKLREKNNG